MFLSVYRFCKKLFDQGIFGVYNENNYCKKDTDDDYLAFAWIEFWCIVQLNFSHIWNIMEKKLTLKKVFIDYISDQFQRTMFIFGNAFMVGNAIGQILKGQYLYAIIPFVILDIAVAIGLFIGFLILRNQQKNLYPELYEKKD